MRYYGLIKPKGPLLPHKEESGVSMLLYFILEICQLLWPPELHLLSIFVFLIGWLACVLKTQAATAGSWLCMQQQYHGRPPPGMPNRIYREIKAPIACMDVCTCVQGPPSLHAYELLMSMHCHVALTSAHSSDKFHFAYSNITRLLFFLCPLEVIQARFVPGWIRTGEPAYLSTYVHTGSVVLCWTSLPRSVYIPHGIYQFWYITINMYIKNACMLY